MHIYEIEYKYKYYFYYKCLIKKGIIIYAFIFFLSHMKLEAVSLEKSYKKLVLLQIYNSKEAKFMGLC